MRIAHCIRALLAVLGMTAVFHSVTCNYQNEHQRHHRLRHYNSSEPLMSAVKPMKLINEESRKYGEVDCCPSVQEMIEPDGGENQDGKFVELFKSEDTPQRFYEISCHPGIADKPCRFIDRKLQHLSTCVQKYSYTYAIVKDDGGKSMHLPAISRGPTDKNSWRLDYIKVRSGCACIMKSNRKKRTKGKKGHMNT